MVSDKSKRMARYVYLVAFFVSCVSCRNTSRECAGSITYEQMEDLLKRTVTDVVSTLKADQDQLRRDQQDLRQEQTDLKEHILARLEALEEKILTVCVVGPHLPPPTTPIPPMARDCQEVYDRGYQTSGIYQISLDGTTNIDVYCEQELDGGGWVVLQSRHDGSVNFYRYWAEYKIGFGNLTGEFWLGNDNIHLLTKDNDQELKIELKYREETAYADYSSFWIEDESEKYKLNVSGFSGANPPSDSLIWSNNGAPFLTKDRLDTTSLSHCKEFHSGWWHGFCIFGDLNGPYGGTGGRGIVWFTWKGIDTSLTATRMMIRKRVQND